MAWIVELQGDPDDLREFSQSFNQGDITISLEGERYLLKSSRFDLTFTPQKKSGQTLIISSS